MKPIRSSKTDESPSATLPSPAPCSPRPRRDDERRSKRWTLDEIVSVTGGRVGGGSYAVATGISTDTRTLRAGEAFVALRGDRFDGSAFAAEAVRRGASCIVTDLSTPPADLPAGTCVVLVDDAARALSRLAEHVRAASRIPWIATTGSAGKTTTKELIAAVAGRLGAVLKAPASFNNRIGVSLTVLALSDEHVAASVEIGTNSPGEVRPLARLVRPAVAVVTTIGPAHLGRFGSVEAIAREKSEILRAIEPGGLAVLPADSAFVRELRQAWAGRTVTFGLSPAADVRAEAIDVLPDGRVRFVCGGDEFALQLGGLGNVCNALAAIAVADELGVEREATARALAEVAPLPLRGRLRRTADVSVYEDCYNANPLSFASSLGAWLLVPGPGRRWAVAGDMRELGDESPRLHVELGGRIARSGAHALLAVGEFAAEIARGAAEAGMSEVSIHQVSTAQEAVVRARHIVRAGDCVLVKGSRSVGLERVVDALLGPTG
jgi:UDP-N-acetylmuramoyl-tripeptide--D-alanyl-D-alanine ligase